MQKALAPHDVAKWTAVTYLPFLWRPEEHIFLKPMVTTNFAARVGHGFSEIYRPQLDAEVNASMLDMAHTTKAEIAQLGPVDNIDIQSFIWVVGEYGPEEEVKMALA